MHAGGMEGTLGAVSTPPNDRGPTPTADDESEARELERFVRVDEIVTFRLDNDEGIASDHWFLSIRVSFESFPFSRRPPLGPFAVEPLGP